MDERDGLVGVLEAVLGDDGVEVESFARRRAGGGFPFSFGWKAICARRILFAEPCAVVEGVIVRDPHHGMLVLAFREDAVLPVARYGMSCCVCEFGVFGVGDGGACNLYAVGHATDGEQRACETAACDHFLFPFVFPIVVPRTLCPGRKKLNTILRCELSHKCHTC